MGKKLIIKGADFSENCIKNPLPLEQGLIDIIPAEAEFGENMDVNMEKRMRTVNNLLIPSDAAVVISGLKGLNGSRSALRLDYCAYTSNERTKQACIGTGSNGFSDYYFPYNSSEKGNSVTIHNKYHQDLYFGFTIASGDNKDVSISNSDYSPLEYSILYDNREYPIILQDTLGINISMNEAEFGNLYITPIRMSNPCSIIYIEAGKQIKLSGLSGASGATNGALRVDACIYSSALPSHANAIHTLNGDSTNYYKFNTDNQDECIITAPYSGYYRFTFAGQNLSNNVLSADFPNVIIEIL